MTYSRLKCPLCESFECKQEARFVDHLTDVHNVTDQLTLYLDVMSLKERPTCSCSGECLVSLPWAGWKKGFTSKYARGHNARVDSIYFDKERQKAFTEKRIEGFKSGRNKSWNVGLTKETDVRIREGSKKISASLNEGYASGSIVDWRILDPEKAKLRDKNQSETMISKYNNGELTPWNKGKTKETDDRLLEISKKISSAMLDKQGTNTRRHTPEKLLEIISEHKDKFDLVTPLTDYQNKYQRLDFRCVKCDKLSQKNLMMLATCPVCFHCHPKESKAQIEIFEFVKSLAPDAVSSDRTMIAPKELDVYVPSKRLGIEYDGLYFHSEEFLADDYAYNKANLAAQNNISLFGIFEDEWRDKQDLVKSMIVHRLGLTPKSVFARKCKIVQLTPGARKQFMDRCHIDGDTRSKSAWGLVDKDNNIVAAMSIRRPFHKTHADVLEVGRFCVERGVSVPGALAKLSAHILKEIKSLGYRALMTYVDTRIGRAKGYQAAGFKVVRQTKARFWWTDFVSRFDRFSIRADSKNGITQKQRALDAGVVKIWGCSNVVLELS